MNTNIKFRIELPVAVLALATAALAQQGRTINLPITSGQPSKTLKGDVARGYIDYVVPAKAGQILVVKLQGTNSSTNFNILPPGSEAAMVNTSISGDLKVSRMLPTDGTYRVRVYNMRAAARRGEKGNFTLTVGLLGKALAALSSSADPKVTGTAYHATAEVAFTHDIYPDLKTCSAGVIRRGRDGSATVEFTFKGQKRSILFVAGKAVASDAMEPVTQSVSGAMIVLRVGNTETYRFAPELLTGG